METSHKVIFTFFVLIFIVGLIYYGTQWVSRTTGYSVGEDQRVQLAQCISGKNIDLYYSRFCADCAKQKEDFGSGFNFLKVIDCDKYPENCTMINGDIMPAWKIDNEVVYGYKNFSELKNLTGCIDG